jgi:phosphoenolpyruvate carboxykinase (GTP)
VPVSAILFGGRRPSTIPLVHQSLSWEHGVFLGSILGSEVTAAIISDKIGQVRRDPYAMLPFIGYHVSDYIKHWLEIGRKTSPDKLPKSSWVNWFRKRDGKIFWPGYGENSRVINNGSVSASPVTAKRSRAHRLPARPGAHRHHRPPNQRCRMQDLFEVDKNKWAQETASIRDYFATLGDNFPQDLKDQLAALEEGSKN